MPVIKSKYLDEIIKGWNERLNFNNIDLTNLVPFTQLYALYDNKPKDLPYANDEIRIRNNEPMVNYLTDTRASDILTIEITDKERSTEKKYYFTGIEIAKLESQVASKNQKGGVGIETLKVNRGTRESFLSKYDMEVVVTDVDIFKTNLEYTSMYSLNQHFLIMHGWSSTKMGVFIKPPIPDENRVLKVDLNNNHKGYWMTSIVSLQKFRFSLDQQSHLRCNLTFLSSILSKLIFKRTSDFSKNVLKDLQTPTFLPKADEESAIGELDIERIEKKLIEDQGGFYDTRDGRSFRNQVYVFETRVGVRQVNAKLNQIKQIIDRVIKPAVGYDSAEGDLRQGSGEGEGGDLSQREAERKDEQWRLVEAHTIFVESKADFVHDISIDSRKLEHYISNDADREDYSIAGSNRAALLEAAGDHRVEIWNYWYNNTFKTGATRSLAMVTLAEVRQVVSQDMELNRRTVYGTYLHSAINDDDDFKLYNPLYDTTADRSQFDDADNLLDLPKSATINTYVTTKAIEELNPPLPALPDGRYGAEHVTAVTDLTETVGRTYRSSVATTRNIPNMWKARKIAADGVAIDVQFFRRIKPKPASRPYDNDEWTWGYVKVGANGRPSYQLTPTGVPSNNDDDFIDWTDEFGNGAYPRTKAGKVRNSSDGQGQGYPHLMPITIGDLKQLAIDGHLEGFTGGW